MLEKLFHSGWRPRLESVAFIEWDPRDFNTVADHAANSALDSGCNWDRMGSDEILVTTARRWRLSVDGAYRGDGTAAAGVAIYAYDEMGASSLMARCGRILRDVTSALVAELVALEIGLDVFGDNFGE